MSQSLRRVLTPCLLAGLLVVALLSGLDGPALADSSTSATWFNDPASTPASTLRFDTDGQAIDVHSTSIVPVQRTVGGVTTTTYYMYGEGYGCGWTWQYSTATQRPFCGVNIYSSPDLQHWTKMGPAIADLNQVVTASGGTWETVCASGCFRPKVVYNQASGKYVMWINVADPSQTRSGYVVLTSTSPSGGFTYTATPQLAPWGESGDSNGDENLFVDTDGTAWVVYARIQPDNNHWLIVERLNTAYTGSEARPGLAFYSALKLMTDKSTYPNAGTEAPSLFKRGSTYYLVFGPTCPYCAGTPTYYAKAANLTGTWGPVTQLSSNSCGGQPDMVFPVAAPAPATTSYVYVSDQWQGGNANDHNIAGTGNQALASEYFGPLSFDSGGNIQPISCQASTGISSLFGSTGSDNLPSGWQGTDTSHGAQFGCVISDTPNNPSAQLLQTFSPQRAGTLDDVWISAYQRYNNGNGIVPTAPLVVQITTADDGQGLPGTLLAQVSFQPSQVGWTPSWLKLSGLNIPVTQADVDAHKKFDIVMWSPTVSGCYGAAITNLANQPGVDAYPYGFEHQRVSGTWSDNGRQDLVFRTNL